MSDNKPELPWRERMTALASAQSRYMTALAITGLFFYALDRAVTDTNTVQLIGLEIDSAIVWAAGPAALALLVKAFLGAVRATGVVIEKLSLAEGQSFEAHDTAPNILDFVFYTTADESKWLRAGANFAYALFLWLFYGEAAWLFYRLFSTDLLTPGEFRFFVTLGIATLALAAWPLASFSIERVRRAIDTLEEDPFASPRDAQESLDSYARTLTALGKTAAITQRAGEALVFELNGDSFARADTIQELARLVHRRAPKLIERLIDIWTGEASQRENRRRLTTFPRRHGKKSDG
jgi:hypothetical protein